MVVPVHNGAHHLAAALESILAQEYRPREVIVVDDGSTDATPSVVSSFSNRVHSIRQDNLGPSAARNIGIAHATAPLIAFLDADDVWLPAALLHHVAALGISPAAALAWGLSSRVAGADARPPRDDWHGRPQWALSVGAMLFRRCVFDIAGYFDLSLRIGEDLDLLIRITEHDLPITRHAHVVCQRRLHATNISRDETAVDGAHFIAIAKAFERRRRDTQRNKIPSI